MAEARAGASQSEGAWTDTGVGGTHLLLVVIFDGIFVAFLQPGKRQAHLGGPPDLGACERDLETEGGPRTPPRERRFLTEVFTPDTVALHRRTAANSGRVSSVHPSPHLTAAPSTQLGPGRGSQRSTAPSVSPHRSPQPRGSRGGAWRTSCPAPGSARPLPGDGATGTREGEHVSSEDVL